MPASNAASVQARVCSKPTPPAKVNHEPSLRYLMLLLATGTRPAGRPVHPGVVGRLLVVPGGTSSSMPSSIAWSRATSAAAPRRWVHRYAGGYGPGGGTARGAATVTAIGG